MSPCGRQTDPSDPRERFSYALQHAVRNSKDVADLVLLLEEKTRQKVLSVDVSKYCLNVTTGEFSARLTLAYSGYECIVEPHEKAHRLRSR